MSGPAALRRLLRDGGVSLKNPKYYTPVTQAVQGALDLAMRKPKVKKAAPSATNTESSKVEKVLETPDSTSNDTKE